MTHDNLVPVPISTADCKLPFAKFNHNPHQEIEVPDGGFTASFRTSEGKRLTVCFVPYNNGGPPKCVDVAYYDSGKALPNGDHKCRMFHSIGFTVGSDVWDTRTMDKPCTLLTVLIDDETYNKKGG